MALAGIDPSLNLLVWFLLFGHFEYLKYERHDFIIVSEFSPLTIGKHQCKNSSLISSSFKSDIISVISIALEAASAMSSSSDWVRPDRLKNDCVVMHVAVNEI